MLSQSPGSMIRSSTQNVSIFPNPAKDKVTLQINGTLTGSVISVYDMMGRKQFQTLLSQGNAKIEIDIHSLKSGLYFIEARTFNSVVIQKLVVE